MLILGRRVCPRIQWQKMLISFAIHGINDRTAQHFWACKCKSLVYKLRELCGFAEAAGEHRNLLLLFFLFFFKRVLHGAWTDWTWKKQTKKLAPHTRKKMFSRTKRARDISTADPFVSSFYLFFGYFQKTLNGTISLLIFNYRVLRKKKRFLNAGSWPGFRCWLWSALHSHLMWPLGTAWYYGGCTAERLDRVPAALRAHCGELRPQPSVPDSPLQVRRFPDYLCCLSVCTPPSPVTCVFARARARLCIYLR